jgi:tetratricopeptide (TPR) repeat protein
VPITSTPSAKSCAPGKPDEEIAFYRQALEAGPQAADICWHAMGDALRARGKPDDAIEAYRQAVAAHPQALEAMPEAKGAYWRVSRYWRAIGDTLIAQGKSDEALLAYRQFVAIYRQALDARPRAPVPESSDDPYSPSGKP